MPTPPGPVRVTTRAPCSTERSRDTASVPTDERRRVGGQAAHRARNRRERRGLRRRERRTRGRRRRRDRAHRHRAGRCQPGILPQHVGLQPAKRRRRLQPQLLVQALAEVAVDLQRVGVPAAPIQRGHQLHVRPLAQRVRAHQRLQAHDRLFRKAQRQRGVDPVLGRRDPQLLEPVHLCSGELLVGELRVRRATPQRQGRVQQRGRAVRLTPQPRPGLRDQVGELR